MKLLAEISEGSLSIGEPEQLYAQYELRKGARAIIRNKKGKIALQYLQTRNIHKLPGGGLEKNEELEDALRREVREEVGCEIEIQEQVGVVIEYRNMFGLIIFSYCFIADVAGELGEPQLEQAEIEEGTEHSWETPEAALKKIKQDIPSVPKDYFILARERAFLEEYLKTVQGNKTEIRI